MTLYVICAAEFLVRFLRDSPVRKHVTSVIGEKREAKLREWNTMKILVISLFFEAVFLFFRSASFTSLCTHTDTSNRSIYRTIELANGWRGPIISTQVYFSAYSAFITDFC